MSVQTGNETTPFSLKYQLERDFLPFNRDVVRGLPKGRSGVYAIWLPADDEGENECLYVGMSRACVRQRLLQHLSDEANPKLRRQLRLFREIVLYSAAFTHGEQQTRALEALIIRDWQPETNRNLLQNSEEA